MTRETANQIADTIENVTRALAEWTVNRHVGFDPKLPEKYGMFWRSDWVGHVESRLRFLVQAIALEQPALFASAMRWTAQAHCGDSDGCEELRLSLQCMRDVVDEELPPPALDPIHACIDAGLAAIAAPIDKLASILKPGRQEHQLALDYISAIVSEDEGRASKIIADAETSGLTRSELYIRVLQPAMHEIGLRWHRNEMTIAEEHLATAITRDIMARLRASAAPPSPKARRVVATTVAGDFHDIGLHMATDLLRFAGWRSWFLGANMPTYVLIEFLKHSGANLLLLSVSTSLHLRAAVAAVSAIRQEFDGTTLKILVGGSAFDDVSDLWRDIGADGCAHRLEDITGNADELVPAP